MSRTQLDHARASTRLIMMPSAAARMSRVQLSGVTELRRQLEAQLAESAAGTSSLAAQVASLQAALERASATEAALTARLAETAGQLASSSEASGCLRAQNNELLAELATLRCVCACGCMLL